MDNNSVEMPINRNISYATRPSHSSQADAARPGAAAEYSRIGPSYETSRRQLQPVAGRNRDSARLSDRYEFSEPHLAMISAGAAGGGGTQGDHETGMPMDYEVPVQNGEHEEYSHLQH